MHPVNFQQLERQLRGVPVALVLAVQLPSAQLGVVRAGAVRDGSVVVICVEEREPTVVSRDGRAVPLLRTVVLTPSVRGARVDEDAPSSCEVMREAVVRLLRGGEVSREGNSGRSVPPGLRLGGSGFGF